MRPDANPRDYLVAESPAMRAAVAHLERIADSDGPALVLVLPRATLGSIR